MSSDPNSKRAADKFMSEMKQTVKGSGSYNLTPGQGGSQLSRQGSAFIDDQSKAETISQSDDFENTKSRKSVKFAMDLSLIHI